MLLSSLKVSKLALVMVAATYCIVGCRTEHVVEAPAEWQTAPSGDWELVVKGKPDSAVIDVTITNTSKRSLPFYPPMEFRTLYIEGVPPLKQGGHTLNAAIPTPVKVGPGEGLSEAFSILHRNGWVRLDASEAPNGKYACRLIYSDDGLYKQKSIVGSLYSKPFFVTVRNHEIVGVAPD